jgi:hypothetical protein
MQRVVHIQILPMFSIVIFFSDFKYNPFILSVNTHTRFGSIVECALWKGILALCTHLILVTNGPPSCGAF